MDEQIFFNLPKRERIEYLRMRGFNTPRLIKEIKTPKELIIFESENKGKKYSIRSQVSNSKKRSEMGPHFPNVDISLIVSDLFNSLKKGYDLLVYEPIDPKLCERKGNILIDKIKETFLVEFSMGSGTVRSLESEHPNLIREIKGPLRDWVNKEKNEDFLFAGHPIVKMLAIPFKCFILEFSEYSIPVGIKKMKGIFWELRKG